MCTQGLQMCDINKCVVLGDGIPVGYMCDTWGIGTCVLCYINIVYRVLGLHASLHIGKLNINTLSVTNWDITL